MLTDPVLTSPADDESLELGRALLAQSTPEQVAAALIRLYREKLPPPEDIYDDERMKRQQESRRDDHGRPDVPFTDFARGGDMAWFRINIGRDKNADPKWLMPMICRLGHVTKRDIGAIRIFDRDTKFEITRDAEARFVAAVAQGLEDGVRVESAVAPGPKDKPAPRWDKPPRAETRPSRPDRPAPRKKPWNTSAPTDAASAPAAKKPWPKKPGTTQKPSGEGGWTPQAGAKPAGAANERPWKTGPRKGGVKGGAGKPKPGKTFKKPQR